MQTFPRAMLTLDDRGLLFGRNTTLAKPDGRGRMNLQTSLPRITGILNAVYNGPMPDYVTRRIAGALESWNKGQCGIAITKLTQIYLPDPFIGDEPARRITKAEMDFDRAEAEALRKDDDGASGAVAFTTAPAPAGTPMITITGHTETDEPADGDGDGDGYNTASGSGGYDPDEPRIPASAPGAGQWTTGDDTSVSTTRVTPATPSEKQAFVDTNFNGAKTVANQLGVPVENILGISALESGWGKHPYAKYGNNFFGLHAGAKYNTGSMKAHQSSKGAKVSTFDSYADSAKSFSDSYGHLVKEKKNPSVL